MESATSADAAKITKTHTILQFLPEVFQKCFNRTAAGNLTRIAAAHAVRNDIDVMHRVITCCNMKSNSAREFAEMGTTLVAAVIREEKLFVVHVGDSRAYLYRKKMLKPLTTDHSYVMELVKPNGTAQ